MGNNTRHIEEFTNNDGEFLISIGKNGKIITVNQPWLDYCVEYELPESLWKTGADYFAMLEKNSKEIELQSIKRILSNDIEEHKQLSPFTLADGSTQWFQIKVRGAKDTAGHLQGVVVHHSPVSLHTTQPISAELILESMTEGFYLLDEQMNLMYLNEIGEKLLQCSQEDVIGKPLLDNFSEIIDTPFHYHYELALKEKTVSEFIDYYKPLDTWFQVKAYPLKKGGLAVYFQDVTERKMTEAKLAESAYYDYLTGLPNHRLLTKKVNLLVEEKKRFSVFHLAIDNLNLLNAAQRYNSGDNIIKKVAEVLSELVGSSCLVARMSRNEFIILKEADSPEISTRLAQHIEEIFQLPICLENSEMIIVNISVGVAEYPLDSPLIEEVISYAELAMEEAKNIRGSSHAVFQPTMKLSRDRRAAIEKSMTGDLKKNGFYFMLQPQIDGNTGKISGTEILSRWTHPEFGEVSPLEFIQIAQETGAIFPLTVHLLEEVFAQLKTWEHRYGWKLSTAINMTSSLLSNPRFFDKFIELMDQYDIDPGLIEIEITEQAELTYSPQTLENLLLYKSKGMSIAIDDFGTGFSMISYLTTFPINKIKIDRSFVQKIGHDCKSQAVLKSLIYLAKSIECELLAEGVEKMEEVRFLQENDCHVFQGYLFDKPLKPTDFEQKYIRSGYRFPVKGRKIISLEHT